MRRTHLSTLIAVLMLAALGSAPAIAQPGRGGGGFDRGMGGVGALLMSEEVRNEVGIQEEQMEELTAMRDEIRDEMRERMQGLFQGFRDMSEEERQEARDNIRSQMQEIQADVEKRVGTVLTKSQLERLKQIDLQQQVQRGGTQSLLRGAVADKLGITEEQREQMRVKAQEEQAKLQEQIAKLQQEARDRVLSVLTDSQRAQLDEMMGKKFDMPQSNFQRGGRGRGGPQGDRPPRGGGAELE